MSGPDTETVHLSRKWLNSVFWLALGVVFGLLAGCSTIDLGAAQTGDGVYVCLVTPHGDQCYKVKGSSPETEDTEVLE